MTMNSAREKLLAERQTGIGGSDAGKIYDLDRGCYRQMVYEKRGAPMDFPEEARPEYERGELLEDDAIEVYRRRTGAVIVLEDIRRSAEYPHMIAHLDGLRMECDAGPEAIIEVKVVNKWALARMKKTGLLASYVLQVQHSMFVAKKNHAVFIVLCPDPWDLAYFDVKRDDVIIASLIQDEEIAWKAVTEGPIPDQLPDDDIRCGSCPWRRTCKGIESFALAEDTERGPLERDDSLWVLAQECLEAENLKDAAEELYEEARAKMKAAIGNRPGVIVRGSRWILSRFNRGGWDTKALERAADVFPMLKDFKKTDKEQVSLRGRRTAD